jgi:hypothetical protein
MDALSPTDAEVTLRSLTRRFRSAVAAEASDDEASDALADRVGPDGNSVVDHVVATIGGLSVLDRALEQVLTSDRPVLHAGVVDPAERDFAAQVSGAPLGLDDHLLDLEITADRLADRIDDAPASDWTRRAQVAGRTESVQAIDLIRQAVAESIDRLRAAQQTLDAVRRS